MRDNRIHLFKSASLSICRTQGGWVVKLTKIHRGSILQIKSYYVLRDSWERYINNMKERMRLKMRGVE